MSRPARRRLAVLGLVWLGGALGTGARYGVARIVPPTSWPAATLAVNLVGAFLLGLLLGRLAIAGRDTGRPRWARFGLGTGILGGFTTFSTLSLDTVTMLRAGHGLTALAYALLSVVLGAAAAAGGLLLSRAPRRTA